MGTIAVTVIGVPAEKVAIYRALQFVLDCLDEGHSVEIYLEGEAILVIQKRPERTEMPAVFDESIRDCKRLMEVVIARGAKVKVCEVCAKRKSLQQNQLYEGVEIASLKNSARDFSRWLKECDKMAFFSGESFECHTKEEIEKRRANLEGSL